MSTKDIRPGDVVRIVVPGCTDGWDVELIGRASEQLAEWEKELLRHQSVEPTNVAGRKIAAVIYEDELPEVRLPGIEGEAIKAGSGPESCAAMPDDNPNWLHNHAASALALARHIEDRDAAAKEQERVEKAGKLALYSEFMSVGAGAPSTVDRVRRVTDRAYELGARAPQGEGAQG